MRTTLLSILALVVLASPASAAVVQIGPWIITTDYEVFGQIESFWPDNPWNASGSLSNTPSDAVGRFHDDRVYVVGRGGSNLIRVHEAADLALVREFSVGADRNPQDIVFDDAGRAFVPCYDDDVLLQVDVETGTVVAEISTAAYADADGLPETGWATIHDGKLYVTCQNLDRDAWYSPTGPGRLLVLDLGTLQWLPPVQLTGANPYTRILPTEDGRLLVGCAGYWAMSDAGVEAIDPVTGLSEGMVATETELGGDVLDFAVTGADELHVLISDASFATSVVRMRTDTGAAATVVATAGYDLADIFFDGDFQLYVADRQAASFGLRVFDTATGAELTAQPITTGLPPYSFVVPFVEAPSAVPSAGAVASTLRLSAPCPNPCNPLAELTVTGDAGEPVDVSVFDLRGRRVLRSTLHTDGDGRAVFRFEGRDRGGRSLAAGAYRIVAQGASGFAARTVTLVK